RTMRPLKFQVGTSAFGGRNTDIKRKITELSPNYTIQQQETVASDEWGVAGDVSLDVGPLRLRTEFALNRTTYDDGKRPLALGQPGVFAADRTRWGGYILAAYQLPVAGLEPYAYFDLAREPLPLLSEDRAVYSGG